VPDENTDKIPELLGIADLRRLAPEGIGDTILYTLLRAHGVQITVMRRFLHRDKWRAFLRGELKLPSTSSAATVAKRAAEKIAKAAAEASSTSTDSKSAA